MILGVMPDAMSEWKPLMAPQAMVMKQKGKSLPATTSPLPATAKSTTAGIRSRGNTRITPAANARIVPSFMNVDR